jgi:hypothetical protein
MVASMTLCVALALGSLQQTAAQSATDGHSVRNTARAAYAQARPKARRVRPRIRVTPAYPYRLQSLPYPPPYDYEYPGPGAVRQCTARLVQEARPSGTVIVPRMTCRWERG